jgi:hypothetical protein
MSALVLTFKWFYFYTFHVLAMPNLVIAGIFLPAKPFFLMPA